MIAVLVAVVSVASPYWYNARIHNLGNVGPLGFVHAAMAPTATFLIDSLSYNGFDVRKEALSAIPTDASVLDLCCGVGFSTLKTGVDTSREMLSVARVVNPGRLYFKGNAETFGRVSSFDYVTMCFATHEMPKVGRIACMMNAVRVARRGVIVLDIDPDFEESLRAKPLRGAMFLSGEPYLLNYMDGMDDDVSEVAWKCPKVVSVDRVNVLPGHCTSWWMHLHTPMLELSHD